MKLAAPPASDLAISIFLPKKTLGAGIHYAAHQTSYIARGDQTGAVSLNQPVTITSWVLLTGVQVLLPVSSSAVVAFGDSITDGALSTVDANRRWPDILARRLLAQRGNQIGVAEAGIGGNSGFCTTPLPMSALASMRLRDSIGMCSRSPVSNT